MHRVLTIAFFLSLITFIPFSTTAQALINYKVHPVVQVILKDGSVKCGYYDACNDLLYDCLGNSTILNPINIDKKVASNDCCNKITDTDKDGVSDGEDKCIDVPGPASNFGCPLIPYGHGGCMWPNFHIYLDPRSHNILPASREIFDQAIQIMKDNPSFRFAVQGHTDSIGNYDANMKLSEARATLVAKLLIAAGIDKSRITTEGFGPNMPIAPNKTAAGRARNRRVDLRLRNY